MIKKAFTTIELIIIIVLIGILSGIAVSIFRDDKLALAAYQVLEHVRYTQHLALSEHKFDPKDATYHTLSGSTTYDGNMNMSWWQIRFGRRNSSIYYSIYSDRDREGNIDLTTHVEAAKDPLTQRYMMYDPNLAGTNGERQNQDMLLSSKYGITNISINNECRPVGANPTVASIYFDEKGRVYRAAEPVTADLYKYIVSAPNNCAITLTGDGGRQAVITINPETGYAEITRLD